jgi:hypothetical protein
MKRDRKTPSQRPRRSWWWTGAGAIGLALLAWFALRSSSPPSTGSIPGPIGDPSIAMDVNTLVGRRAPEFSLPDAEGKLHVIRPDQGRPIVLVLHMGFY